MKKSERKLMSLSPAASSPGPSLQREVGEDQLGLLILKEEDTGKEDMDNPEDPESDNEAAHFLVMLASRADKANTTNKANRPVESQLTEESVYHSRKRKYEYQESMTETRVKYKCNTCKKLFNSHKALGGHRESHRKVKGCFAITYVNEEVLEEETAEDGSSSSQLIMMEYHPANVIDLCSWHERGG